MKNHSIKFITAIALAVVFTLSAMYSTVYAVTRADVPQSYSLENFFNVEYGDREENVTAGGGEPGDGLWFEPEIYAITPSGDIYAADTYNPVAHMPVKQFDSTGKYIRTIPCSTFTNGDITGMTVLGNTLCVLTSDNYLCAFNIETGEVTKHIADVPEGFDYYSMVTVGNCAAIIYDRFNDIENSYGFYELKFLTFDTVLQSFVPSDDMFEYCGTLYHHADWDRLFEMGESFLKTEAETPRIMYIWGHSYEFDIFPQRWKKFEEFCEMMSKHHDIFYGTNIRVFEEFGLI